MKRTTLFPAGLAAACLLSLGVSLGASPARAQTTILREGGSYRSPQRWVLELRFGPYSPDVDSEFEGAKTPHRDFFGGKRRLMTQLELDYQVFQGFGSLALGVQLGYFRENGLAFREPPPGEMVSARSEADNSRLSLYPFALLAVYRADQLWQRARIPFVPYAKIGLSYTLWSVYDGNDKVAESLEPQGRGRGGTLGWQAAAGASLVLNVLDPGASRELDSETGINNTHLFVEMARFAVTGLGEENRLRVGDTTWLLGLAFDF